MTIAEETATEIENKQKTKTPDSTPEQGDGIGQVATGQDTYQQQAKQNELKSNTTNMAALTTDRSMIPQSMTVQYEKKEKNNNSCQEQ